MTDKEFGQNLLLAYIEIKGAQQALSTIMEFKHKFKGSELLEIVKEVKPKLSYFVKKIDETLLSDPNFSKKDWLEAEEKAFESLELIDEFIKKM